MSATFLPRGLTNYEVRLVVICFTDKEAGGARVADRCGLTGLVTPIHGDLVTLPRSWEPAAESN